MEYAYYIKLLYHVFPEKSTKIPQEAEKTPQRAVKEPCAICPESSRKAQHFAEISGCNLDFLPLP